jgi:hypothetical protein
MSWLWGLHAGIVETHATDAAPGLQDAGAFPLLVFSPSVNPPHLYSALLTELASHGFVVAGVSHTYEVMPLSVFADAPPRVFRPASTGGAFRRSGSRPFELDLRERARVVDVKADDLQFVIGSLIDGRRGLPPIDRERVGVLGHSFGGGAAAEVCMRGVASAGVSIDGGLWREPGAIRPCGPFLQLYGEHEEYVIDPREAVERGTYTNAEYASRDRATTVGAWQAMFDASASGRAVQVRGANHPSFCDWPVLPLRRWSPARRVLAGISGDWVLRAASETILEFLGAAFGRDVAVRRSRATERTREAPPHALFRPEEHPPAGQAATLASVDSTPVR